jgi:hypothetical protein
MLFLQLVEELFHFIILYNFLLENVAPVLGLLTIFMHLEWLRPELPV